MKVAAGAVAHQFPDHAVSVFFPYAPGWRGNIPIRLPERAIAMPAYRGFAVTPEQFLNGIPTLHPNA